MQRKKDHWPTGPRTAGSICSKKHHGCYKNQFDELTWIGNLPLHWIELAHRCSDFQLSLWRSEGHARNYAEVACWEPLEPETHSGSLSPWGRLLLYRQMWPSLCRPKTVGTGKATFRSSWACWNCFHLTFPRQLETSWVLRYDKTHSTAESVISQASFYFVIAIMIAVGLGSVHFSGGAFKPQSILQLQITYFKCRRCVALLFVHSPLPSTFD